MTTHQWQSGDQVQVVAALQIDMRFAGRVGVVLGRTLASYWVAKQQVVCVEFEFGPMPVGYDQRISDCSVWNPVWGSSGLYHFRDDELEPAKYDRIMLSVHILAPDTDDQSDEIARHTVQLDMVKLRSAIDNVVKSVDPKLETWVE